MSIDYSQITFRTFEILAQKYLERKYPDFKWHITPSSGDGNKDILCKYKVLDQEHQYWAEAKFTRSRSPHKLSKGQLDPTLVSALLSSIPVSLCFISNSQITESYYYRLKDFKLKTNIGVELVLKDEFENWLLNNPDILKDYNIKVISHDEIQDLPQFQIHSAIITDILNVNQYKTENYLLEKTIYYLYIIISSKSEIAHASLKCSSGITLLQRSGILENPNDFKIEQGKRVYKFELLPHIVGTRNMTLKLIIGEKEVSVYTINDLVIKSNSNITLSYVQQEKSLHEISRYIRESCEHNFLIPIVGSGATGKTKLIQDLYCELNSIENVLSVSFIGNEYLDARTLLKILLFFNIGNVFDYEQNDIRSQLELLSDEKQKIFYKKLLDGWFISPESCVKELIEKILSYDICLLYPSHSRVKQIVLLDDVHKGKSILSKILGEFVKQFMVENNNQVIVFACREYYEDFMIDMSLLQKDWIKMYYLKGLTKEDKQTTISQYFSYDNDIHFHSATDDLIVFSNILQSKLSDDESKKMESDSISKNVDLVRAFENPKIVNNFQYREKLNHLRKYNNILEIVYLMNFGIDYAKFIGIFSYNDIEYLLEKKVIKRVGKKYYLIMIIMSKRFGRDIRFQTLQLK